MGLAGEGELGEYREFEIKEDREVPLVLGELNMTWIFN
jgi:hypothetical protein